MVKTAKDVKMSKGNKANIRPIKLMKMTSEEREKRSKKYVILTKRPHGRYSDAKNKKKKSTKQNTQLKFRNKSSIKTTSKKEDKTTTLLEPTKVQETKAKPTDYLNNAASKSLHNIPLTRAELKHLFNKYKKDGHFRVDANLPPFASFVDNPKKETNVTLQIPSQTTTLDYKTSPEHSNYNSPYTNQCTSMENPPDLQIHTDLRVNDINTYTFVQQHPSVNESYNAFNNTYIMNCNNNVSIPNTLHDPARMQSIDSLGQFHSDNENPYDLSYRTSCSSMSDSNTACNMSSFGNECFQDNIFQGLETTAKNNLNDYNNLKNHSFIDSYIPTINPTLFDNNNDCPNMHNNDKLCNVVTQIWDNKQLTQVFPLNTNDPSFCQVQNSTFMENHLKQYGVSTDTNNTSHLPQGKNHVCLPYKNQGDRNNNFSTVPLPVLAPNLLYDINNF